MQLVDFYVETFVKFVSSGAV